MRATLVQVLISLQLFPSVSVVGQREFNHFYRSRSRDIAYSAHSAHSPKSYIDPQRDPQRDHPTAVGRYSPEWAVNELAGAYANAISVPIAAGSASDDGDFTLETLSLSNTKLFYFRVAR